MIDPVAAEPGADLTQSAAASALLRPAFRRELTPTWLSAIMLLAGHRPPDPERPLRVLDLHCGSGVTVAVIAAAHPEAEVWAVDDRPANIERTDRLVTGAGLRNVMVLEADLAEDALPRSVDIVLVDDVVSTTDEDGRARLAALIGRHVRSGGLVVVAYRTRIGWSEVIPLRSLATLLAPAGRRPTEWQLRAIVDLLERLRAGGAGYIVDRRAVSALVEQAGSMDGEQLSDILLTEHLEPMALADVAEWLTPTGAVFVGSAQCEPSLAAGSPLVDLLDDTQDRRLREAFSDLVARPTFRIDVFRRGAAFLPADEQLSMLLDLELVGLSAGTRWSVDALAGDQVARAVDLLREGPAVVRELVADGGPAERIVRALMGRGLAHPRSAGWASGAAAACCALNRCLGATELGTPTPLLARADIGSAIPDGDGS